MFTKVLVPVDLAEPEFSSRAIRELVEFLKVTETQIRLVTVRQLVPQMVTEYLPADYDREAHIETEKQLAAFADRLAIPAGRITTAVRIGGVYHEVLEEAKEFGADLIVVGSHHPTMATYLLGSNAANIVRHAPCSVLVVRD